MHYREFAPPAELASHVLRLWTLDVAAGVPSFEHSIMPDGTINLVAMQRGTFTHVTLQGPHDEALRVPAEAGDRYWGVRCWPDAGGGLFGIDPMTLRNAMRPASDVCPDMPALVHALAADTSDAAAPVWQTLLAPRLAAAPPLDLVVRRAVLVLIAEHGRIALDDLASRVQLGARQLQRRFRAATGLTVKAYARVRRVRAAVGTVLEDVPASWAGVAATYGFADQAHLAREFRALTGMRPRDVVAYVARFQPSDVEP